MDMKILLLEIKDYIEKTEGTLEDEFGSGRELEQLIKTDQMPEIYAKVIEVISDLERVA